jgi:hypothetical protein
MRRDVGENTQFLIFGKINFWAWRTNDPDRIETPQQISIYAHPIWQRKSPVSEAIARKIEQILPVGQISDAQCAIAQEPLAKRQRCRCPARLTCEAHRTTERIFLGTIDGSIGGSGQPREKRRVRGEPAGYELREEPHALRLACLPLCEEPNRSVHVQVGTRHPHQ